VATYSDLCSLQRTQVRPALNKAGRIALHDNLELT